jgi:hypothetical protein
MELTERCIKEIILAAKEAENSKLVITIDPRPEDSHTFDLKCDYTRRLRVTRTGIQAYPTEGKDNNFPHDKYSS